MMRSVVSYFALRLVCKSERWDEGGELRSAEKPADPEALRMNWNPNKSEISDSLVM